MAQQSSTEVPSTKSLLEVLTKARLVDIGRLADVSVSLKSTKDEQIKLVYGANRVNFDELLGTLSRDELKAACRAHGIDDSGRARAALADRLRQARGVKKKPSVGVMAQPGSQLRDIPKPGDIVQVRHRQYMVQDVVSPPEPGHKTLVRLVCLDDDNQGRRLEVLWELELGASVRQPEQHGLGDINGIDLPRYFAAHLHALKWNSVSATNAKLFQAPFRAGIKLMDHQLTPLRKALDLPRANLFIADDVGLGKTIEAGLVLQELLLRQRVEYVLIVCPAAIALQWRDEMQRRFGLHFEIYNRAFVARRRQERGFGINPWGSHNRFIISYQTLRRPEYRDPLLSHLGAKIRKSLLILDEAHSIAPASASKYATDSHITSVIRELAPRFENRLFLSATPHNGHSNSFSSLLEILDRQRFTRGVPVTDSSQLDRVMVRRLKADLKKLGRGDFPLRKVIQIDLTHANGKWAAQNRCQGDEPDDPVDLGQGSDAELVLSQKLAEYKELMDPRKGRGHLVFVNLQKRLLSSVEAFYRTLQMHQRSVASGKAKTTLKLADTTTVAVDDDERGMSDDDVDELDGSQMANNSRLLESPEGQARRLLDEMLGMAEQNRSAPTAKVLALLKWIQDNQCPAVALGGAKTGADKHWTGQRVLVFTEYGDTKRFLWQILNAAVAGTDQADERIMHFHGGMSDEPVGVNRNGTLLLRV